jgi:hypothetical protein
LQGAGFSSIIKPISGSFDVISTAIPGSAGLSGYTRNYIGVEKLMIDCSNMTGTTAGQGNAIHWYGARWGFVRDVFFKSCKNWAVLLDGDNTGPGNNFSYNNDIRRCIFDLCNANVQQTNSEANDVTQCQFKWCGGTTAAAQPVFGSTSTTGRHLWAGSGYLYASGNVFGNGGTYASSAIQCDNSGPCRIENNRFDQVRAQAVVLNGGNHIVIGNQFSNPASQGGNPGVQVGSSNNIIEGNKWDTTAGGPNYTYAIAESGGPFTGNVIQGNNIVAGLTGTISQNATSQNHIAKNAGYNPTGKLTAPGIPATTVAQNNYFGVDCMVLVTGGTVSNIAIGGQNTGQTTGWFRVPSGSSITLTYTVVPTSWTWWGD